MVTPRIPRSASPALAFFLFGATLAAAQTTSAGRLIASGHGKRARALVEARLCSSPNDAEVYFFLSHSECLRRPLFAAAARRKGGCVRRPRPRDTQALRPSPSSTSSRRICSAAMRAANATAAGLLAIHLNTKPSNSRAAESRWVELDAQLEGARAVPDDFTPYYREAQRIAASEIEQARAKVSARVPVAGTRGGPAGTPRAPQPPRPALKRAACE